MVNDIYQKTREAYRKFYRIHSIHNLPGNWQSPIIPMMDEWSKQHPKANAFHEKMELYRLIAENFDPVIFPETPLFWATGKISFAEEEGMYSQNAGAWVQYHPRDTNREIPCDVQRHGKAGQYGIHLGGIVDIYHRAAPFTDIIERGLTGFYEEAQAQLSNCHTKKERDFITAAMTGLKMWQRMADRFAEKAESMTADEPDPAYRANLQTLAQTARRVPWNPPETFIEVLSTIVFVRNTLSFLDGVGQHVYGLLDRTLYPFYKRDLDEGRITPGRAKELIAQAFLIHDSSPDEDTLEWAQTFNRGERSSSVFIGGRDSSGREVCNDLTFMVLDVHHELKLHFPKLCVRVTRDSAPEYLRRIARDYLAGRNVMAIMNDDAIIKAQLKTGKRYADVVRYVNSACWEIVIEGCEHSAGANNYLNLLRLLDLSINRNPQIEQELGYKFAALDGALDFEDLYSRFRDTATSVARQICKVTGSAFSRRLSESNPQPIFSACLKDCLAHRRDYTAGGARYNPHGLPLLGFANVIDSLLVLKTLCFDRKTHTLAELLKAVRADWNGFENLRAETGTCPFFGDGSPETGRLAQRLFFDIRDAVKGMTNERGGPFQLGFYSSWEYMTWGKLTGPTPDGRKSGEVMANGISPSRRHAGLQLSDVFRIPMLTDITDAAANASLDLNLPLGGLTAKILENTIRAFAAAGGMQLQMNCISRELLKEAQKHPEQHRDILVRIYGLSVRFVTLSPEFQNEVMSRSMY